MNELLLAATSTGSEKVTCTYTQENSVWGFKLTGKTTGYESNSVFFPVQSGDSSVGKADFWSGTADGSSGWDMFLKYDNGNWCSDWYSGYDDPCLVRPVLKN